MKLNLDALIAKSEKITSNELLNTISGGTEESCHVEPEKSHWQRINDILNW